MIKKVLLSLIVMTFVFSGLTTFAQDDSKVKFPEVKVDQFQDKATDMIGNTVEIQGMVTHVCKHGGKKMFIMSSDPDVQVKITVGENIAAFPVELEGSNVWVKGKVEEMMVEVEEEEGVEHEEDEAHKNIYHKPQYSVAAKEYKVTKK